MKVHAGHNIFQFLQCISHLRLVWTLKVQPWHQFNVCSNMHITCIIILILSFIVNEQHLSLLSIFHTKKTKWICVYKQSVRSSRNNQLHSKTNGCSYLRVMMSMKCICTCKWLGSFMSDSRTFICKDITILLI